MASPDAMDLDETDELATIDDQLVRRSASVSTIETSSSDQSPPIEETVLICAVSLTKVRVRCSRCLLADLVLYPPTRQVR